VHPAISVSIFATHMWTSSEIPGRVNGRSKYSLDSCGSAPNTVQKSRERLGLAKAISTAVKVLTRAEIIVVVADCRKREKVDIIFEFSIAGGLDGERLQHGQVTLYLDSLASRKIVTWKGIIEMKKRHGDGHLKAGHHIKQGDVDWRRWCGMSQTPANPPEPPPIQFLHHGSTPETATPPLLSLHRLQRLPPS